LEEEEVAKGEAAELGGDVNGLQDGGPWDKDRGLRAAMDGGGGGDNGGVTVEPGDEGRPKIGLFLNKFEEELTEMVPS